MVVTVNRECPSETELVDVFSCEYKQFSDLSNDDAIKQGYVSVEEMKNALINIYDFEVIEDTSVFTIVLFSNPLGFEQINYSNGITTFNSSDFINHNFDVAKSIEKELVYNDIKIQVASELTTLLDDYPEIDKLC